ncbi:hypothetical protein IAU59_006868 [Kwoniella sp. CBS 9459]
MYNRYRRRSETPPSAAAAGLASASASASPSDSELEEASTAPTTTRSQSSTPDSDPRHRHYRDMAGRTSRASTGTRTSTGTGTGTGTTSGTWTGTGTGTSVTIWSDDQTEMPGPASAYTYGMPSDEKTGKMGIETGTGTGVKEGRLIDYDPPSDTDQGHPTPLLLKKYIGGSSADVNTEMAPGDKLRELLRMMQQEVEISKPASAQGLAPALPTPAVQAQPVRNRRDRTGSVKMPTGSGYGSAHEHGYQIGYSSRESSPERGRTRGQAYNPERHGRGMDEDGETEDEEESPPTPPPRINNPYSARRANRGRNSPALAQSGRLPSRAAVLLNSTSRSLSPEPQEIPNPPEESQRSPPTRLEAFLASHPSLPPTLASAGRDANVYVDANAEASTSRSKRPPSRSLARRDSGSGSSITSSRKGKGRETTSPVPLNLGESSSSFTRRNRLRQRQQSQYSPSSPELPEPERLSTPKVDVDSSVESQRRRRLPPTTPRRVSIDVAPDDSASFARSVGGLEVRAEVELDLDEGLSGIGWSEVSESVVADEEHEHEQEVRAEVELDDVEERTSSLRRSLSLDEQSHTQTENQMRRERSTTARLPEGREGSTPLSRPLLSPPRPKSADPNTSTSLRHSHSRQTPAKYRTNLASYDVDGDHPSSASLPALPEPDLSRISDEDEDEVDTYSSRRTALFRSTSTSRSRSGAAGSKSASASESVSVSKAHARSSLSAGSSKSREEVLETTPGNANDAETSQQSKSGSYLTDIGSKSKLSRHSIERSPQFKEDTERDPELLDKESGAGHSPFVKNRILPRRSPQSRMSTSPTTTTADAPETDLSRSAHRSPQHHSPSQSMRRRSPVGSTADGTHHSSPIQASQYRSSASSLLIPPQPPIRVGMALTPPSTLDPAVTMTGTPLRSHSDTSTAPTPRPPGAWQYTPKGKVRFTPSPLGKGSPLRPSAADNSSSLSMSRSLDDSVSIHRLKLSPRRNKTKDGEVSKMTEVEEDRNQEVEAETSFIGRLKESFSGSLSRTRERIPIPRPSTAFIQATSTLQLAQSKTLSTQQQLEATQRQWLEALSALNTAMGSSQAAKDLDIGVVVRKGWSWGTWTWWVLLEVIVLWSVFRVTLDYATSISHLTSLDPFHPLALPFRQVPSSISSSSSSSTWGIGPFGASSPISLTIPIPSALQSLVGRQASANFFDLVEGWEFWRMLIGSGVVVGDATGSIPAGARVGRMLAGVPS